MAMSAARDLDDNYFLYQIRNRKSSAGFGFDGYHGITGDARRRQREHFKALKAGTHSNRKLQTAYNADPDGWEFYVAYKGKKAECEARERLLVPQANHHLNQQKGGGRSRGISQKDAIRRAHARPNGRVAPDAAQLGKASGGTASAGLASEVAATAALAAGLMAVGAGTGYIMNKTVFKDDGALNAIERQSRAVGRKASITGGIAGGGGTAVAIFVGGEIFGLTGGGLAAGLTALGGTVVGGTLVALALPAAAAAAAGGAMYGLAKWWKFRK